jgi:hypothetical protein
LEEELNVTLNQEKTNKGCLHQKRILRWNLTAFPLIAVDLLDLSLLSYMLSSHSPQENPQ